MDIGGIKESAMYKRWLLLGLILCVACIARFYQLGVVPHGLTWDEAAIGYNGYAVITTRRDEWLERLPLSFRSFGDYKAPLAIYVTGIGTTLFGLSPLIVRLPFALAGVLSCLFMYLFIVEASRFSQHTQDTGWLPHSGAFLLAISPWHIHFSRIGFEVGLSLCCILGGLWLLFFSLNRVHETPSIRLWVSSMGSMILFVLSLYAYHSAKIFVPLLLLSLLIFYVRKEITLFLKKQLIMSITVLVLGAGLLYPLVKDTVWGNGATRAGVLITQQGYSLAQTVTLFATNFAAHLRFSFMLPSEPSSYRHSAGYGVVYISFLLLLLVAGYQSIFHKIPSAYKKLFFLAIILVVCGIVPAALAQEAPHENRAHLAVSGVILVEVVCLAFICSSMQKESVRKTILGIYITMSIFCFVSFLNHYFTVFAARSTADFQDGYLEALQEAVKYEKGSEGKPKVNTILFSSEYGQPYIFALFVRRTNPIWYRGGSLNTYLFTDSFSESDLERSNTLLVVTQKHLFTSRQPDYKVLGSDGSLRFALYYTQPHVTPAQ